MSSYLWIYGCVSSILGSIFSNMGVNVQKYSQKCNAAMAVENQLHHCQQPLWFAGLLLVIVGAIADLVALSLAAQSIIAPIGSVTLVANVIFASFFLEETLTWLDLIGTGLVIAGAVISVIFGDHGDQVYNIRDIEIFYEQPAYVAFVSIALVIVLAAFFAVVSIYSLFYSCSVI